MAKLKEAVRAVVPELETIGFNPPPSQEEPLWLRSDPAYRQIYADLRAGA